MPLSILWGPANRCTASGRQLPKKLVRVPPMLRLFSICMVLTFGCGAKSALEETAPQVMLTDGIASAYRDGKATFDASNAARTIATVRSRG